MADGFYGYGLKKIQTYGKQLNNSQSLKSVFNAQVIGLFVLLCHKYVSVGLVKYSCSKLCLMGILNQNKTNLNNPGSFKKRICVKIFAKRKIR